jgi:hypothetical protein
MVGAAAAVVAVELTGGDATVASPLAAFFVCDVTYGTPIEAPISEAMISGFDAMLDSQHHTHLAVGQRPPDFAIVIHRRHVHSLPPLHENDRL